jgi:predicted nucleotidyltransferase
MKIGPIEYVGNLPWLNDNNVILFVRHGSQAYGLATEFSDLDLKGIAIPPKRYYFGLDHFEQAEIKDKNQNMEAVIYEIKK